MSTAAGGERAADGVHAAPPVYFRYDDRSTLIRVQHFAGTPPPVPQYSVYTGTLPRYTRRWTERCNTFRERGVAKVHRLTALRYTRLYTTPSPRLRLVICGYTFPGRRGVRQRAQSRALRCGVLHSGYAALHRRMAQPVALAPSTGR